MQFLKSKIEAALDCRIYRNSLPRGADLYHDLYRSFNKEMFRTVFDVGANVGQSALKYSEVFPTAEIYSFEPVKATYETLFLNTKQIPRIHTFNTGMGKEKTMLKININANSTINSLLRPSESNQTEDIAIDTISDFCTANNIATIDFMKSDTEGFDLSVLAGCSSMLEKQQIKVVMVECEPVATNNYFVSLTDLATFFSPFGYKLFGIYEQQLDWNGNKSLLFFNAVFVCPDLVHNNLPVN
ncbi:MAG: FkbM family methyltransferase [Chitinophagaceae bacterium]|nr:MAG: FkbM family methyltransferase [Chitinophagaceae bacterium]